MAFRLGSYVSAVKRLQTAAAVPTIGIANNTFTIKKDGNKKNVSKLDDSGNLYIRVLIVDANPNDSKVYYKEDYSDKEDDHVPPTCWSDDGIMPAANVSEKQCDSCAQCPHNVWGSKISAVGSKVKACSDYLKVAVKIPDFSMKDEDIFLLRIPPNSRKNWFAYINTFGDIPEEVFGRPANPGDFATFVWFDQEKVGLLNFAAAELEDGERGEAERIGESGIAASIIGIQNVQVQLPAPEAKKQLSYAQESKIEADKAGDRAVAKAIEVTKKSSKFDDTEEEEVEEVKKPVKFPAATRAATPEQMEAAARVQGAPKGVNLSGMRTVGKKTPEAAPPSSAPKGIPGANLPAGLRSTLDKIMGTASG